MGYRSQIALAIAKEDCKYLKGKMKENKELKDFLKMAEIKKSNNAIVISWDWIKWYDEFPEVRAIKDFMYYLSDNDRPYRFIRIGEENDDTEIETNYGDGDNYNIVDAIDIYRGIDINI